jgi:hypothetical protein
MHCLQNANPSPDPDRPEPSELAAFVVKNGSNIWVIIFLSMPQPLSET